MVRDPYLIENGSYRYDHRARREVCSLMAALSAADICVQPAPPNRLNQASTMNKPMEYMELGKPIIAYGLKETMVTGGDVCQYMSGGGSRGLADKVNELASDAKLRATLGKVGRKRVEDVLSWPHQATDLLQIYEELFPGQIEWGDHSASA
jgi:glycosyltransferase involved in cell wall biosynthesis